MSGAATSAVYEGTVRHVRHEPREHRFALRLGLPYVDLERLDDLLQGRWLWSARRRNVAWFRRADYMAPHDVPLAEAVRRRVEEVAGVRPSGPVCMLGHLRTLGWCFNPVTFYWCFGSDGSAAFLVAEITNTPWGERHSHVLDLRGGGGTRRHVFPKSFHVSPFLPMDLVYEWRVAPPGERLGVHMRCLREGRCVLEATLALRRRAWGAAALRRLLVRHAGMTWRVSLAIYVQALRLALKRVPFHAHPRTKAGTA